MTDLENYYLLVGLHSQRLDECPRKIRSQRGETFCLSDMFEEIFKQMPPQVARENAFSREAARMRDVRKDFLQGRTLQVRERLVRRRESRRTTARMLGNYFVPLPSGACSITR